MELTHVSLFSGIGGADIAAEAAGFATKIQVENDPFCNKILQKTFPHSKHFLDIHDVKGSDIVSICGGQPTVLSGEFPCQPVSAAGKKLGSKDSRWLWPEYFRIIKECRPHWIVAENVAMLTSLPEFDQIYADIESENYEIAIFHLSAADVGSPHKRIRCFVVAHTAHESKSDAEFCNVHLPLQDWSQTPENICRMDNGLSAEIDKPRMRALGNTIVPRQVYPIFETISAIERA